MTRLARNLATALVFALTTWGLASSHRAVGYARDEGIYFEASRRQADWIRRVVASPTHIRARSDRDRVFAFNREHPPVMKLAAATSLLLFANESPETPRRGIWPVLSEGAAMRLPAQLLTGLGVALLFWTCNRRHRGWAGWIAAGWFITLPRVWFHAGLHAFDVPVAIAVFVVVLAWRRALRDPKWGIAVGPLLGIAIAIKHNALFVVPLLLLHHLVALGADGIRDRIRPSWGRVFPLPVVSVTIAAPLCAWLLWPWLWHAPWSRLLAYAEFHRAHSWYNVEFLGVNYNQPPMPWGYPWLMIVATVPLTHLVLAIVGLGLGLRDDRRRLPDSPTERDRRGTFWAPRGRRAPTYDGLLLVLFALFPVVLIALPATPIFGGTKHWIVAYPLFALAAARAWVQVWAPVPARLRRWLEPAAVVVVLAPATMASIDAHPYGASQYAPVVGGPRGAADMGLMRGFWGHAVRGLLPQLPHDGTIEVGDIHELSRRQYQREGLWSPTLESVPVQRARDGLLFYEKHMATYEFELWNRLGTTRPQAIVTLDDVPLTAHYAKPP